jgi:hypothetical protein
MMMEMQCLNDYEEGMYKKTNNGEVAQWDGWGEAEAGGVFRRRETCEQISVNN